MLTFSIDSGCRERETTVVGRELLKQLVDSSGGGGQTPDFVTNDLMFLEMMDNIRKELHEHGKLLKMLAGMHTPKKERQNELKRLWQKNYRLEKRELKKLEQERERLEQISAERASRRQSLPVTEVAFPNDSFL
jgi:predicted nuclease with TOPRIM domain